MLLVTTLMQHSVVFVLLVSLSSMSLYLPLFLSGWRVDVLGSGQDSIGVQSHKIDLACSLKTLFCGALLNGSEAAAVG